jgi:putative ABC transport system ATP-binding protein
MTEIVKLEDIVKDYPSGDEMVRVLHGINLSVNSGQLTMIVGPSGCGKTTLLSIITGILTPTSGTVTACGKNITKSSDRTKVLLRRRKMGFIFQQFNLLPSLNAAENAGIPLIADGMSIKAAAKQGAEVLESIGMAGHTRKLPSHLSGGQQQRVAIARALVHQPNLIVCDEPTASLDAKTGHKVLEILRDVAKDPEKAVIIVTHDNRIFEFADRIIHMDDGKIIKDEVKQ